MAVFLMEDLLNAAAAAEAAEEAEEAAEPPAKRHAAAPPFMKKVQGIQTKLDKLDAALAKKEAQIAAKDMLQQSVTLPKKERETIAAWRTKVMELKKARVALDDALEEAKAEADTKKAAAANGHALGPLPVALRFSAAAV